MTSILAIAVGVLFFMVIGMAESQAQTDTTLVPGCVVNGSQVSVEIDNDVIASFDGALMAIHGAAGIPIDHSQPLGDDNSIPVCAVEVNGTSFGPGQWLWCTNFTADVCSEGQLQAAVDSLTAEDRALMLWEIDEWEKSGLTTTMSMAATQLRIWCITDEVEVDDEAFPTGIESCVEYREFLEAEVLPDLVLPTSSVEVTGPTDPVPVGEVQTFQVTSTIRTLELSVSGGASVELCDPSADAELNGSTLVINDRSVPVELCVTGSQPGTVDLTAASPTGLFSAANIVGNPTPGCQVLFIGSLEGSAVSDSAAAEFLAQEDMSTTSSTSTSSSSTTSSTSTTLTDVGSGGDSSTTSSSIDSDAAATSSSTSSSTTPRDVLPRTGADVFALGLVAFALVTGGAALLIAERRRRA